MTPKKRITSKPKLVRRDAVAAELKGLRGAVVDELSSLHSERIKLREHLAVQCSHNRRLIDEKRQLQEIVDHQRQQLAVMKAAASRVDPQSVAQR